MPWGNKVKKHIMEYFAKGFTTRIEIIKPIALREKMIYNSSVGLKKI